MKSIISRIFTSVKPSPENKNEDDDRYDKLINDLVDEWKSKEHYYSDGLSKYDAGKVIMDLNPEDSLGVLIRATTRYVKSRNSKVGYRDPAYNAEEMVMKSMIKRKLPFDQNTFATLLATMLSDSKFGCYWYPIPSILKAAERLADDGPIGDTAKEALLQLTSFIDNQEYPSADDQRYAKRVLKIISSDGTLAMPINAGEAWGDLAIADIENLPEQIKGHWLTFLSHCATAKAGKPSKKWLKEAAAHITVIGLESFSELLMSWLQLLDAPRTIHAERRNEWHPDPNLLFDEINADILKGLIWCASLNENADMARLLMRSGIIAYKKIPGIGAKSARLGNAVIYALSSMPGKTGLYQLAVLKVKVKYRQALAILENSLKAAAERENLSVAELEEMGVPSFGLTDVGAGEEAFGDHTALLKVNGFNNITLTWRKADGKEQKTIPAAVKENLSTELKDIKGAIKDIKSMLSVQKERLEQLFLKEVSWSYTTWKERYLDHPIVGVFSRKLIWGFETAESTALAHCIDGRLVTVEGTEITDTVADATVRLWHPIQSTADVIKDWRTRLETMEITQPFKQAHREIYLLTDAEVNTNTYSNRYASHIIKQHQFNALAAGRGWRYTLQGCWDGGCDEIAHISLPQFNLRAEFWVSGVGEYGQDTAESGIFLYLSTDQVRFYAIKSSIDDINENNIDRDLPLSMAEVPALAFSEVFRDIDLFVGVCSVGNDAEWSDGGPDGRYRDYWHSFSFGELSATAATRKEILQNLVPKLKFGKQCKFVDRFLVVEGKRRIYKIHLGSGNILMEPNNQYLCIVADNSKKAKAQNVFLPFEGDKTLSVILSKAALLAADDKITDSTINSQIGR